MVEIWLSLLTLVVIMMFILLIYKLDKQQDIPMHIVGTEDRVAEYIKNQNSNLDIDTVYKLSNAIVRESEIHEIPVNLMLGLIKTESHFRQYEISNAGAMGFWQILPKYHLDKIRQLDNKNLYDADVNTTLGANILKDCLKKHKRSLETGLSCYNGSASDRTKKYARKVLKNIPLII
jgi:soluble lytic murein transglycosylase-like protein